MGNYVVIFTVFITFFYNNLEMITIFYNSKNNARIKTVIFEK